MAITNLEAQTRVIWMAVTMSVVLYGVIAFVIVPGEQTSPFESQYRDTRVLAISVSGLMFFLMSLAIRFISARVAGRGPLVMRWMLTEIVAVCGLVAAFLGQDFRLFLPLGGLALAGMLLTYPSSERLMTSPQ